MDNTGRNGRMKMKRRSPEEHNAILKNMKSKPDGMPATEWNSHLDDLKRQGKYNGEKYAHTRTRVDELWEIGEDLASYNRGK